MIAYNYHLPPGLSFVSTGSYRVIHLANPLRAERLTICNKPYRFGPVKLHFPVCSYCLKLIGPNPKGSIRSVQRRGKSAQLGDYNA